MKFGIFMAPFHRTGENPTLCFEGDLELIEWLDSTGYDEVFIGEHHSSGWEIISSPIFHRRRRAHSLYKKCVKLAGQAKRSSAGRAVVRAPARCAGSLDPDSSSHL